MDDVEAVLLQQQGLVGTSAERVQRAIGHLDREMQQLDMARVKLEADVRDKVCAEIIKALAWRRELEELADKNRLL